MQQLPPPDFAVIQAFVALADTGSFAAAGKMLGKDPTVLSRRITMLERRLGVRLAERSTRHVALTEAGRAYLARVRPLLHELETADRDVATFADGEPRGHLRLSLPTTFSRMWLDPLIIDFAQAHPLVSIEAEYSNNFAGLVGEAFDAAVRLGEMADSRLIARKIGVRRRLACAAPAYLARHDPIQRPEDLVRHACLVFTGVRDPFRWTFKRDDGQPIAVPVTGPLVSDDADLLLAGALAGLGILYTTDWHVAPLLRQGALVELLPDWPTIDRGAIYIVTPAAGGTPSKTRAFSDWIANGLNPAPWLEERGGKS